MPREQLHAAFDYIRDGDRFIVTKLDRLAVLRTLVEITEAVAASATEIAKRLGIGRATVYRVLEERT